MAASSDKTDTWKSVLKKTVRYTIQIGIIGYLFYKLYDIGFANVIESLPLNPLFYLIYLVIYFSLPLSEIFIYRIGWDFKPLQAFMVFIQKKVLNTDVLGYSGEVYLFYWAKEKLNIPTEKALHFIKDNNILSSISSTFVSVLLLFIFMTEGYLNPLDYLPNPENSYIYFLVGCALIIAAVVGYQFRHYILSVSLRDGIKISSIYTGRLLFNNILQIFQYALVKPDIPWAVWFSLMAVQILSSRIPFLPSQDVLYVNLALEMSDLIRVPEQEIVGILTANLILQKLIGAISYIGASARQSAVETVPQDEDIEKFTSSM